MGGGVGWEGEEAIMEAHSQKLCTQGAFLQKAIGEFQLDTIWA